MSEEIPAHSIRSLFVGRNREMAELRSGLDDAREGRGRFFLITGEPGIGKTRLADELATHAASVGITLLRAGCWEGASAPAYWPFMQVLRAALQGSQRDALLQLLGSAEAVHLAHDLTQLLPELRLPDTAPVSSLVQPDPEQARFRLFDSVTTVIRNLAKLSPLMLVLEDLHDADQPSLLMLRFVVSQLKQAPVLVLGTYRDFEVQRSFALSRMVGDLTREGTQVPLFSLGREDVARLIEERVGAPLNPRLVADIHQATAGNPLFIDGVVRVLAAEGSLKSASRLNLAAFRVPDGVRQAIRGWLALLIDRSALTIAAVIGQEFVLRVLQGVTGLTKFRLLDTLRAAADLGIVSAAANGGYRFSHVLIRNALYDELSSADRAGLHLKIGEALEVLHQTEIEAHLTELAHHFSEGGDITKATDYSIRAGAAAGGLFAYADAISHWRAALELMAADPLQQARRADLLERLSELLWLSNSDRQAQMRYLERALALYEGLGSHDAVARVRSRIAICAASKDVPVADEIDVSGRVVEMSERTGNRTLATGDSLAHVFDLSACGRLKESFDLIERATAECDRLEDAITGTAIVGAGTELLIWLSDPAEAADQLSHELTKPWIAEVAPIRAGLSYWLRVLKVSRGDLNAGASTLESEAPVDPLLEGELAFCQGKWEQAEACLVQAADRARSSARPRRAWVYSLRAAKVRRILGLHSAAATTLLENLAICNERLHLPFELHTRQELALLYVQMEETREALPHIARCQEIQAAREDWRGLAGHIARAEGVVTAAEGRLDAANERFASAVETYRRYQLPFEEAETLHYWGRAELAAGHRNAASNKLDAATELYRRQGAGERWLERIQVDRVYTQSALSFSSNSVPSAPVIESSRQLTIRTHDRPFEGSPQTAVFHNEGDYWTVAWAGSESHLKHRKGFDYIAYLLQRPGEELAVADLVAAIQPVVSPSATNGMAGYHGHTSVAYGLGDAGVVLDAAAKAQYKRRLDDLRGELDLAEQANDLGRAETARAEIDFIQREVVAAVGLRGRDL